MQAALERERLVDGSEPEKGNPPSVRFGLGEIVAVPGVNLHSERVQVGVFVGICHLVGDEILTAEAALGVRLEVVVPRRVLLPTEVGGDEDWVGAVMEVR